MPVNLTGFITPLNAGFTGMVEDDQIIDTATTAGNIMLSDGSYFDSVVMSGDATIAANGTLTVTSVGGGGHTHDGDTLQLDGINSDGGAFAFTTSGAITFTQQIISSLAGGTMPFDVSSTTLCTNLNVDLLDGLHVGTSGSTIPNMNASNTWGGGQTFSNDVTISDNVDLRFGSSSDAFFQWYTPATNDCLHLALGTGSVDYSGYLIVLQVGDTGSANRYPPIATDPTLRIYSSDSASSTDWLDFYHNQTDGYITCGTGTINFDNENLTTTGIITGVGSGLTGLDGTHFHDGDTLQCDGISSDGGVFDFITSNVLNLKVSGDATDYLQFYTDTNIPYIKRIGGYDINFVSDDANFVLLNLYEDSTHSGSWMWDKINDKFIIHSTHEMNFRPNNDVTDYFIFTTVSDVPTIGTVGSCNLKITASSGTIDFDDENLTTSGTITGVNVTSGADPGHTHTGASLGSIDISDDTNLVAGTNITLADDTLNVDDAFLVNNASDKMDGTLSLKEQAAADADTAAYGQIWVKTATPNELWFTDDAGTDVQLGVGGGAATFTGLTDTPANYAGSANKFVKVNATPDALEFFDLLATANAWTATQTGTIFVVGDADDTATPSNYLGVGASQDGKFYALAAGTTYLDAITSDADLYIRANDGGVMTNFVVIDSSESLLTLGVAGDTVVGDGTLRLLRAHTASKIDLGSAVYPFNDAVFSGNVNIDVGTTSEVMRAAGTMHISTTIVGNIGAGPDDLSSFVLPANTFVNKGDMIEIIGWGSLGASSTTRTINLGVGETGSEHGYVALTTTTKDSGWKVVLHVIMESAGGQRGSSIYTDDSKTVHQGGSDGTADETAEWTIQFSADDSGDQTDSVIQKGMIVKYFPYDADDL